MTLRTPSKGEDPEAQGRSARQPPDCRGPPLAALLVCSSAPQQPSHACFKETAPTGAGPGHLTAGGILSRRSRRKLSEVAAVEGDRVGSPGGPPYFRLGVTAITHSRPRKPARGGWVTGPAAEGLGEGRVAAEGAHGWAGRGGQGTSTPAPPSEFLEHLPEKEAKAQEGSRTHPRSLVSGEAGSRRSFLHTAWPRGAALGAETVPTRMRTLQSLLLGQGIRGGPAGSRSPWGHCPHRRSARPRPAPHTTCSRTLSAAPSVHVQTPTQPIHPLEGREATATQVPRPQLLRDILEVGTTMCPVVPS